MSSVLTLNTHESGGKLIQLVSFSLGEEEYALDVLKVREIIRMPVITRVPNTPHYIDGVINLRGKVIPIICMRKKLGLTETENDKQTRIIVMDVEGESMGFTVDAVSEVVRVSAAEIQSSPTVAASAVGQDYIAGVANQSERLLILLDLERMFSAEEKTIFGSF